MRDLVIEKDPGLEFTFDGIESASTSTVGREVMAGFEKSRKKQIALHWRPDAQIMSAANQSHNQINA